LKKGSLLTPIVSDLQELWLVRLGYTL